MTGEDVVTVIIGALTLIVAVGGALAIKAFAAWYRITHQEAQDTKPHEDQETTS